MAIFLVYSTSGIISGKKVCRELKMAAILKILKYLTQLQSDLRYEKIVPNFAKKSIFMMMTSSMTSQGGLNVGPLYSFVNEITTFFMITNKANLRDLIAATGLVILLKLDSNCRFFARVTLQFDVWPWKTIGHLFYATSSFVHHFVAIGDHQFKLRIQSGNAQFGSNSTIFRAMWPWNLTDDLKNNRAPLQCYFKLCVSFRSHRDFKLEI